MLQMFLKAFLELFGIMGLLGALGLAGCVNQNDGTISIGFESKLVMGHTAKKTTGSAEDDVAKLGFEKSVLDYILGNAFKPAEKKAAAPAAQPAPGAAPATGGSGPPPSAEFLNTLYQPASNVRMDEYIALLLRPT